MQQPKCITNIALLIRSSAFEYKIYHFGQSFGAYYVFNTSSNKTICVVWKLNDKNQFKLSQLKRRAESSLSDIKFVIFYSEEEGGKFNVINFFFVTIFVFMIRRYLTFYSVKHAEHFDLNYELDKPLFG